MCATRLNTATIEPYLLGKSQQNFPKVREEVRVKLFSLDGASITIDGKPCNVCIEWHQEDPSSEKIDGIFFRIYSGNHLEAYLIKTTGHSYQHILVESGYTQLSISQDYDKKVSEPLFEKCSGAEHTEAIQLEVQHLQHPEQIKAFFEKHRGMIPEPLYSKLFSKQEKAPAQEPECCSRTFYYIGGALLLTLGTLFVVKKYFPKYNPIKYVQLPYSLSWVPENLRRIAKA